MSYVVYCDGACSRNGQTDAVGGVGIVVAKDGKEVKRFAKRFVEGTITNNRMELLAAIAAIKCLPEGKHTIVTDSQYVVLGVNKWLKSWEAKGWKKPGGGGLANKDLWQQLAGLLRDDVTWTWCKGHSGDVYQELSDTLAVVMTKAAD